MSHSPSGEENKLDGSKDEEPQDIKKKGKKIKKGKKNKENKDKDPLGKNKLSLLSKASELPTLLVDMIIRPPRAKYQVDTLGPQKFALHEKVCERIDVEIINERGFKLKCSHFMESPPRPSPCVIYLHGNCGCRLDSFHAVTILLRDNISVFAFDFSGSGLSEGEYISLGYFEKDDVKSVVEYLRTIDYVTTIGLWGRSMGAATAIMYGASDPSIAGMILDSPFTSLKQLSKELVNSTNIPIQIPKLAINMGLKAIRKAIISRAHFDIKELSPISYVSSCYAPALFVHGKEDTFILPHHCEDLYELYAGDKNIIMVEGNHNSARPEFFSDSASIFFQTTLLQGKTLHHSSKPLDQESIEDLPEIENSIDCSGQQFTANEEAASEESLIQQALLLSLQGVGLDPTDQSYVEETYASMSPGTERTKEKKKKNRVKLSVSTSYDSITSSSSKKKKRRKECTQSLTASTSSNSDLNSPTSPLSQPTSPERCKKKKKKHSNKSVKSKISVEEKQ